MKFHVSPAKNGSKLKVFPLHTGFVHYLSWKWLLYHYWSITGAAGSGLVAWTGQNSMLLEVKWPGVAKTCIGPWGNGQEPPQGPLAAWRPRAHGWDQAGRTDEGQGPQLYISTNEVCQGGPPPFYLLHSQVAKRVANGQGWSPNSKPPHGPRGSGLGFQRKSLQHTNIPWQPGLE